MRAALRVQCDRLLNDANTSSRAGRKKEDDIQTAACNCGHTVLFMINYMKFNLDNKLQSLSSVNVVRCSYLS